MKSIVTTIAMSLSLASLGGIASADTLIMRDGTRAEAVIGTIAGGSKGAAIGALVGAAGGAGAQVRTKGRVETSRNRCT